MCCNPYFGTHFLELFSSKNSGDDKEIKDQEKPSVDSSKTEVDQPTPGEIREFLDSFRN